MITKFFRIKRRKVEVQESVEDAEGCSTSQLVVEQSLGDVFSLSVSCIILSVFSCLMNSATTF